MKKFHAFVDFDGTVTLNDVGYEFFKKFTSGRIEETVRKYRSGQISAIECLQYECDIYNENPVSIGEIERFIDKPFDEKAFRKVAHYIYMGAFDRNDTLPSRDAWSEKEADIIKKALAEKMMPNRWELSRQIHKNKNVNAQLVTYNGISHSVKMKYWMM